MMFVLIALCCGLLGRDRSLPHVVETMTGDAGGCRAGAVSTGCVCTWHRLCLGTCRGGGVALCAVVRIYLRLF